MAGGVAVKGRVIAVNAHTIRSMGAFAILVQFLHSVRAFSDPTDRYIVFVSRGVSFKGVELSQNVDIVEVSYNFMGGKLWFCRFGMQRELRRLGVSADAVVSLSNLCSFARNRRGHRAAEFLYFHQAVVLEPRGWNFLRHSERYLWFCRVVLRRLIRCGLHSGATVVTQLHCVAGAVRRTFGLNDGQVMVVAPHVTPHVVQKIAPEPCKIEDGDSTALRLFYPAGAYPYKNHQLLFAALGAIKDRPVKLVLTLEHEDLSFLGAWDLPQNVEVEWLGSVAPDEVWSELQRADALLFPSCIESFGLPLLEAAVCGVPVLATGKPFAREVLAHYSGAQFLSHIEPAEWSDAIQKLPKAQRFTPLTQSTENGWQQLFERISAI